MLLIGHIVAGYRAALPAPGLKHRSPTVFELLENTLAGAVSRWILSVVANYLHRESRLSPSHLVYLLTGLVIIAAGSRPQLTLRNGSRSFGSYNSPILNALSCS